MAKKSMIRRPGQQHPPSGRGRRARQPQPQAVNTELAAVLATLTQAQNGNPKPRCDTWGDTNSRRASTRQVRNTTRFLRQVNNTVDHHQEPDPPRHPGAEVAHQRGTTPARRHERERRERIRTGQQARALPYKLTAVTGAAGYTAWGFAETAEFAFGPAGHLLATTTTGLVTGSVVAAIRYAKRATITDTWRTRFWCASAAATSWITVASVDGAGWGMLATLAAGAAACSARWQRHHEVPLPGADKPVPVDAPGDTSEVAELAARWQRRVAAANRQVPGSTLTDGQHFDNGDGTGQGLAYLCQLAGGVTLQAVQNRAGNIASSMGLDPVQLVFDYPPLPEGKKFRDSSVIRFQVVTTSPITEVVDWTGPDYADGRIGLGPYADGRGRAEVQLFTEDGIRHCVVIGSTGGGKSALLRGLVASARSSGLVTVLYLDPKRNSSPELAATATVALKGLDQAEEFTQAVEALLRGRQLESDLHDWSGFTPSRDRSAYIVAVDECDMLFALPTMARRWGVIAKTGRALGVQLTLATQYAGQKAFGGAEGEMLRSNVARGNVILMRTESNTSDRLIAPELPNSRSLPDEPGYGYLQANEARRAPFRSAFLPSVQNCPDGFNALVALQQYPDAPMDTIGRKACEALWVADPEERQRVSKAEAERLLTEFLGEGPATRPAPAPAGGGFDDLAAQIPAALGASNVIPIQRARPAPPPVDDDPADEWALTAEGEAEAEQVLSDNQRQVLAVLRDGHEKVADIVEVSGLSKFAVSRALASLATAGRAGKSGGHHGTWVALE